MLTLGRTAGPFLRGLSRFLESRPDAVDDIRAVFAGARETANEDIVTALGLQDNVSFCGNIPHSRCVGMERDAHVLLLIKHDDERYGGLIPGKLFEYIGACRPILGIVPEGEAASLITGNGRGEAVPHGDTEGIARAIGKMYDLHKAGMLESGYSLDRMPRFSRRAAADRLDTLLKGL
jgi:glycosyltransferase involved in cell wall biosynthesis